MRRPVVFDAFCGVGGAALGYQRAGCYVIGGDVNPQPNYCGDEFIQMDLMHVKEDGTLTMPFIAENWREFDAIHASPPCQASCNLTSGTNAGRIYPQLIPATRAALKQTDTPWVIENVQGAVMRRDLTLCGEYFKLGVIRHRYFELEGFTAPQPPHIRHRGRVAGMRHGVWYEGPYFQVYGDGGGKGTVAQWQQAMGINWTDVRKEIAEAIPPAYTEYVGRYLKDVLS